jgi:hypothetical protein
VADGIDVRAAAVNQEMHAKLGTGIAAAAQFVALEIGDNEIIRRHHAFADAGRRGENAARIETERDVAIGRGDVTAIVNPAANGANVSTVFVLCLQSARRNGFRIQIIPHDSNLPLHDQA